MDLLPSGKSSDKLRSENFIKRAEVIDKFWVGGQKKVCYIKVIISYIITLRWYK